MMEKIDKKIRMAFKEQYSDREFTLNEALNFFDDYMSVDTSEAILNHKKDKVRSLIGMKENGERVFVSFKRDGQYYYSYLNKEKKLNNLGEMHRQLATKIKGLEKTDKLVLRQAQNVIDGQISLKEMEVKDNVGVSN